MIRLAWRQFRTEAYIGIGVLVVVAVVLAVSGPHIVDVYRTAPSQLTSTDHGLQIGLTALLLVAPALVGTFFGAPLIASELESGTYRLAWTQSVTRARWLTTKLVLVGLASSLLAGGLSLMAAWWADPINIVTQNRFSPSNFGLFGIVPFAYGLFAFVLGATTGLLFRKTLPAVATTLAVYAGARLAVTYWVRPHFVRPVAKSLPLGASSQIALNTTPSGVQATLTNVTVPNGWVISTSIVNNAGKAPSSAFLRKACPGLGGPRLNIGTKSRSEVQHQLQQCTTAIAAKFHGVVTYQPASRYWPFQMYETALFVVLALALAGASFLWVRRRLS